MRSLLRQILLVGLVRPFARIMFGMDTIGREHLPRTGPAIVCANHNSHVDTLVLMCLFPARSLPILRPVAAADHFERNKIIAWFSHRIVGIIPLKRGRPQKGEDVFAGCKDALTRGEILFVFPEGTRGEPEEMSTFKSGVARLAEFCPQAPVVPVYIQGAGRALPRGSRVVVPFNITAIVGEALHWNGSNHGLIDALHDSIEALKAQAPPMKWK